MSTPTVNIEGLVAGYTGPGGKTVLPHRAVAKLDLRLVPDMTYDGAVAALEGASREARLRRHRGEPERRLRPDQHVGRRGRDPRPDVRLQARRASTRSSGRATRARIPGYVFTGEPLKLPAGHFGLGHGSGAHAPDEYFVIESSNPKVVGWDGAVMSYVEYLHELATIA